MDFPDVPLGIPIGVTPDIVSGISLALSFGIFADILLGPLENFGIPLRISPESFSAILIGISSDILKGAPSTI